MMDIVCAKEICCGCRACFEICPTHSITMKKAENGFYYPHIDVNSCIHCFKCQKVCPTLEPLYRENVVPSVYSAYALNPEYRDQGSSGGVFGILARKIINHKGIVFGAAFDEEFNLKHRKALTQSELLPLFKSKYVESDTNHVFGEISREVKIGRTILFCGTPCQCAALKKFLGHEYENLYIIDFLCHGVPSQELFTEAIREYEKKHKGKIVAFNFRSKNLTDTKDVGHHYFSLTIKKNNGKLIYKKARRHYEFPYYSGFMSHNILRPSCYECRYANTNRVSDITLADFWGLEKIEPIQDFRKGYSMVICNSVKGKTLFHTIQDSLCFKEYSKEVAINNNFTYTHSAVLTSLGRQFVLDYSQMSYSELERKYLKVKMDWFHRGARFISRKIKSVK